MGIQLFVDLECEGLCFEGWGSVLCLLIGLGFGMLLGFEFPCSWGMVTLKMSCYS